MCLVNHSILPVAYPLPVLSVDIGTLEELVGEEDGPVLGVPDKVADPSVVLEAAALDAVHHRLGEDDTTEVAKLENLHVLLGNVGERKKIVGDVLRKGGLFALKQQIIHGLV